MLLPSAALADVVTLKGGEKITGIARVVEDQVVVDLGYGTVSVDRDEVLRIRKADSALAQLYRRRQALRRNDVAGRVELARWAEAQGLTTQARGLWREVLELRPEHSGARSALRHVHHEGRWMTREQKMRASGRVLRAGVWMTAREAAAYEVDRERRSNARVLKAQRRRIQALESRLDTPRRTRRRTRGGDASDPQFRPVVIVDPRYPDPYRRRRWRQPRHVQRPSARPSARPTPPPPPARPRAQPRGSTSVRSGRFGAPGSFRRRSTR